jgi:hypothetical protein
VGGGEVRTLQELLGDILRAARCAAVTTRDGAGYVTTAAGEGRKRRSFLWATVREVDGTTETELAVGPRFHVPELASALRARGWEESPLEVLGFEPEGQGRKA